MALWSTFLWSDGTLWGDALGTYGEYTAVIDDSGYYLAPKITHTNSATPGSLFSFVIQSLRLEVRPGPQLPDQYEAFTDVEIGTQHVAPKITHTATGVETDPFTIDRIHLVMSGRAHQAPTG